MVNFNKLGFYIGYVALILFGLAACSEIESDRSGLRLHFDEEFTLTDMQEGLNGEIHCIGFQEWWDTIKVLTFDRDRNLIRETNILKLLDRPIKGEFLHLPQGGWFAALSRSGNGDYNAIDLFRFDENFNILKQKEIYYASSFGFYSNNIQHLSLTRSGNVLMAYDTTVIDRIVPGEYESGFLISCYTQDLNEVWTYRGKATGEDSSAWSPGYCRVFESDDGYINYAMDLDIYFQDHCVLGQLNSEGKLIYQRLYEPFAAYSNMLSLSNGGDFMLVNTAVNNDDIMVYTKYDLASGELMERKQLKFQKDRTGFWIQTSSVLPPTIKAETGHFLIAIDRKRLFYQFVDPQLNFRDGFDLVMPEFDQIRACKHVIRENGNIVVAVTFLKNGKTHFLISEYDTQGNIQ